VSLQREDINLIIWEKISCPALSESLLYDMKSSDTWPTSGSSLQKKTIQCNLFF